MNKILNWTFGACFRTLGKFLAIICIFALFILIGSKLDIELPDWLALNVKATQAPGWASELPALGRAEYKSCSGSNTCNSVQTTIVDYFESPTVQRSFITHESWNMDIGNNGYVITTPTGTTKTGYLYQIDYYICSNKVLTADSITPTIYVSDYSSSINHGNIYNLTARAALGTQPIIDGGRSYTSCYKYSGLVVPEADYVWSMFRIQSTSVISDVYLSLIATEVKELGLYTSTLESIIDNSGFASAESVEEVQDSVNQVQQEIQQTQDTITDSTSPDVSDMTNLAGYLPPGPLDSVLNLPLSILNSLNSKLSSSCTPLSLTLPFVNLPLNIPCLSTIFNQIAGLNVLWESIGVILGALIMYKYLTYLYNWVDDVTSLKHTRARLFGAKSDADNWGGVE